MPDTTDSGRLTRSVAAVRGWPTWAAAHIPTGVMSAAGVALIPVAGWMVWHPAGVALAGAALITIDALRDDE